MISEKWEEILEMVDFAFQPIINPRTGSIFGVEALLRDIEPYAFYSINSFFDSAYKESNIFNIDLELRIKALRRFVSIPFYKNIKFFYNYDYRVTEAKNFNNLLFENIINQFDLSPDMICFEISERHKISNINAKTVLNYFINKKFNIAIDDFGTGYAGLEMFYNSNPKYLKFDKFLIRNIDIDLKKRSFCSHILNLTKFFNVISIAEGVENEKEFCICKDLGFDLIQGFFIQKPVVNLIKLKKTYSHILEIEKRDRRKSEGEVDLLAKELIKLDTIKLNDSFGELVKKLKSCYNEYIAIVDSNNYPSGVINKNDFESILKSLDNIELTCASDSLTIEKFINDIMISCPLADINLSYEKILEKFVNNSESKGIIIIKNLKYLGYLSERSLLKLFNEKNLKESREKNCLTKLPDKIRVTKYLYDSYYKRDKYYYFIYFDFKNFDAFNDKFGFRQGDRVIITFSEILKKEFNSKNCFIGHMGGDDFFIGIERENSELKNITIKVEKITKKFSQATKNFYNKEDISRGYYLSRDKDLNERIFPILFATGIIIELNKGRLIITQDEFIQKIIELKQTSKNIGNNIFTYSINNLNGLKINS